MTPSSHITTRLEAVPHCSVHPGVPVVARLLAQGTDPAALLHVLPLLLLAHPRSGRVLITQADLSSLWDTNDQETLKGLHDLVDAGIIRLESKGPYVVLFIRMWPGKRPPVPTKPPVSGAGNPPSTPPPASASAPAEQKNIFSAPAGSEQNGTEQTGGEEGGVGEDEEGFQARFVRDLVAAFHCLGEEKALTTFCARYPQEILTEAYARVLATPRERLRKGPGALFTYLVKTLDRERS